MVRGIRFPPASRLYAAASWPKYSFKTMTIQYGLTKDYFDCLALY